MLFLLGTLLNTAYAVRTNGVAPDKDYIDLGNQKSLSGVGRIINKTPNPDDETYCTGTLINEEGMVVTCAHAFDKIILSYMEANPECLDYFTEAKQEERINIENALPFSEQGSYIKAMGIEEIKVMTSLTIPLDNYFMDFSSENSRYRHQAKSIIVNPYYMLELKEKGICFI